MDEKYIEFLKNYGLYDEKVLNFIESTTKRLDYSDIALNFFGCYPIINDDGILIGIRMCVPYIKDDITRSINIHEYIHLLELYRQLNKKYVESNMKELLPVFYEFVYLNSLHNRDYLEYYKDYLTQKNNYLKIIIEIFKDKGYVNMEDDKYKELKEAIKQVRELNIEQLLRLTNMVDDIINSNNTDEKYISFVFDHLLSISFVDFNLLKEVYLKLVSYVRLFNKELADDYWNYFIEDFELDEEIKVLDKK